MLKKLVLVSAVAIFALSCSSSKKMEGPAKPEATEKKVTTEVKKGADKAKATFSSKKTVAGIDTVTCKIDGDTRVIEVAKFEKAGCEVFYTKMGNKESKASAAWDVAYCQSVADRMRGNLEKAGFTCE